MATWDNNEKPGMAGGGWDYNEPNMTYDEDIDPDSQLTVYYNGLGTVPAWTDVSKS